MSIEKMREEFEAWVKREKNQFFLGRRDNPQFWHGSDEEISDWKSNPYDHPWTAGAWDGWQASRAALVIELPQEDGMDGHLWAPDVVAAIEAAGVKVKP